MSERLLRLASQGGADRMVLLVRHVVDAWRARWDLEGFEMAVSADVWQGTALPGMSPEGRWLCGAEASRGAMFWPRGLESVIADVLFPRRSDEAAPREESLARASAGHVVEDLQRMLCEQWLFGTHLREVSGDRTMSRWDAPLQINLQVGPQAIVAVVPVVAPPKEARGNALPSLKASQPQDFHAIAVNAELVVGCADIALPDAVSLQVGDVILLDALVKDPLELRIEGAGPVLRAYLGRVGSHRALQVVSSSISHGVLS